MAKARLFEENPRVMAGHVGDKFVNDIPLLLQFRVVLQRLTEHSTRSIQWRVCDRSRFSRRDGDNYDIVSF
jgi:hypothetical protein